MSNGESKIAESKAALCYGFAIALRALFLGILCWGIPCLLIASLTLAMTHPLPPEHREGAETYNNKNGRIGGATLVALIVSLRASVRTRGKQPCAKLEIMGVLCSLIASLALAMTKIAHAKFSIIMLSASVASLFVIASVR